MGSLTLTGQPPKRTPFEPLVPGVRHIPYGDVDALRSAVDSETAGRVPGNRSSARGGVIPRPRRLTSRPPRDITTSAGRAASCSTMVQTGMGRLGSWFAFQGKAGLVPDVFNPGQGPRRRASRLAP